MKGFLKGVLLLAVSVMLFSGCVGDGGGDGEEKKEVTLRFSVDLGWVIHKPSRSNINGVYRYGPSMILNDDGSIDMYVASPGDAYAEWDWGRHRKLTDNGKTLGPETVAVKPTPGEMDSVSTCDPGVVKIGDWYYAGYTSTYDPRGTANAIFFARSRNAEGPFLEKWNGSTWSEYETRPCMLFDGNPDSFGIGEPSFVVKDDILYIYYNHMAEKEYTMVAVADAKFENWPSTIVQKGVAFEKIHGSEDSSDVKYVEEYDMFVAFNSAQRMTTDSFLAVYESKDGLTFKPSTVIKKNIAKYCHNMGVTGDAQGHIKKGQPIYVAYAHAISEDSWAYWYTRMHKVTMTAVEPGTEDPQVGYSNSQKGETEDVTKSGGKELQTLHTRSPIVYLNHQKNSHRISTFAIDNDYNERDVSGDTKTTYTSQNEEIAEISSIGQITTKKAGINTFKIIYDNQPKHYAMVKAFIYDSPFTEVISSSGFSNSGVILNGETGAYASIGVNAAEKWIGVQTEGGTEKIAGVMIVPRANNENFSRNFKIQYKNASGEWVDVPGQVYQNYVHVTGSSVQPLALKFSESVLTGAIRYVDLSASTPSAVQLTEFFPLTETMASVTLASSSSMDGGYELSLSSKTKAQIKVEAKWGFGFVTEYYKSRDVSYGGYDESIIAVSADGRITAVSVGETSVKAVFSGREIVFDVTVSA